MGKSKEELEKEKQEKLKKEAQDKKKKEKEKLKKLREPKEKFPKWSATQNMRKLLLELVFFDVSNLPYRHAIQQLRAREILSKAVDMKIIPDPDVHKTDDEDQNKEN